MGNVTEHDKLYPHHSKYEFSKTRCLLFIYDKNGTVQVTLPVTRLDNETAWMLTIQRN